MNATILKWYDYVMKGKQNEFATGAPVRIFVMGDNVWRDEQEFPLSRTEYTRYYLHSIKGANSAGGDGVISVVSNATPRLMARLTDFCASGDFAEARALAMRLTPWFEAAFIDSNPIPVKAALSMMGKMENVLRLPLVPLTSEASTH